MPSLVHCTGVSYFRIVCLRVQFLEDFGVFCLNFCEGGVRHPGEVGGLVPLRLWQNPFPWHCTPPPGMGLDVVTRSHCSYPTGGGGGGLPGRPNTKK